MCKNNIILSFLSRNKSNKDKPPVGNTSIVDKVVESFKNENIKKELICNNSKSKKKLKEKKSTTTPTPIPIPTPTTETAIKKLEKDITLATESTTSTTTTTANTTTNTILNNEIEDLILTSATPESLCSSTDSTSSILSNSSYSSITSTLSENKLIYSDSEGNLQNQHNHQHKQQNKQQETEKTINSLPNLIIKLILKYTFCGLWPSFDFFTIGRVCKKWRKLMVTVVTTIKLEEYYLDEQKQCENWMKLIRRWFQRYSGDRKQCFLHTIALRMGLTARYLGTLVQDIFEHCCMLDLDLSFNRLGSEGASMIINRLVRDDGHQTLSSLNLANNKILDSGIIDLATALRHNTSIHTLNLSQNMFSNEGLSALFDTLALHNSTVRDLNIEGSSVYDATGCIAKALQSPTCMLTHLNISGTQSFSSNVVDIVLRSINSRLEVLKVNDNQINPVSCSYLAESLSKPDCSLNTLELNNNNIGDDGLYELIKFFKTNSTLTQLSLRSNNLTFCGISHLCHSLSYPNVQLRDLDLSNNPLSINATPYLSFLFSKNPNKSLQICRLRFCQISDFGAQMISQALTDNTTLTYLDLSGNNLNPEGCSHLCNLLAKNTSIRTLLLGNNQIGNTGAKYIADAIKLNKTLTCLDIENNNITIYGAHMLIEALQYYNETLTDINLWVVNVPRNLRLFLKNQQMIEKNK